jgi:uncharacterized protein YabE (DUF348 family)
MKATLMTNMAKKWLRLASLVLALLGMGLVYRFTAKEVHLLIDGKHELVWTHARKVEDLIADIGLPLGPADYINVPTSRPISDEMLIAIRSARVIRIQSANSQQNIRSASTAPANILADAGMRIYPGDELWMDGIRRVRPSEKLAEAPESIRLKPGKSFDVLIDGTVQRFRSSAPTIGMALIESGVSLFEGDQVEPDLQELLIEGTRVEIKRGRSIVIRKGAIELPVQSAGMTVGEVLIDTGFSLSGMDYTVPGLEDPVPADGLVRVVQVEEDLLVELEPLPFETVYQPLETLELDQLQVQNQGTYGVKAERIRIRYEDGEEVSRAVEEAVTVVEPESRVLGYGTKIVVRTLNTGSGTIEYWRAVPVYATSYSPCRLGVDRCGFVTAAGTTVDRGTVGVIRSWFRLMRGWPVFIPGYGPGSIQDIGAGFSDRDWIDLGFTDEDYEAWHGWTTLYFLTPVPPLDQIPWILP